MQRFIFILILSTAAASAAVADLQWLSLFKAGDHCVAYVAKKRLLLLASVEVIGKSCDVAVQVLPEVGGLYRVEINVPMGSLKSGEEKRDRDVAQLLTGSLSSELVFESDALSKEQWRELIGVDGKRFELRGQLKLKDQSPTVQAEVLVKKSEAGYEIDGVIPTSFKALNLVPPNMAMGFFAQVRDDLKLHFHFVSQRTMGAENLLGTNP